MNLRPCVDGASDVPSVPDVASRLKLREMKIFFKHIQCTSLSGISKDTVPTYLATLTEAMYLVDRCVVSVEILVVSTVASCVLSLVDTGFSSSFSGSNSNIDLSIFLSSDRTSITGSVCRSFDLGSKIFVVCKDKGLNVT